MIQKRIIIAIACWTLCVPILAQGANPPVPKAPPTPAAPIAPPSAPPPLDTAALLPPPAIATGVEDTTPKVPDLPPATPESSDKSAAITPPAPPTIALPAPTLPEPSGMFGNKSAAATSDKPQTPNSVADKDPLADKSKQHTWGTKLAPSHLPPKTKFTYRRVVEPETIYSRDYAEYNKHLPTQVTRQDYENMLFASVMNNDVEATRALLNAGADINSVAENGETPLSAARRAGATATTQLLLARGGH